MSRENQHVSLEMESTNQMRRGNARQGRDLITAHSDAEPLFEPDLVNRRNPPRARPETTDDDDRDDEIPYTPEARPGVDDGFFPTKPEHRPDRRVETDDEGEFHSNGVVPTSFPYAPGYGPGFVNINGVDTPIPDVNVYQHKKTLAQGMMDLALLSANANQLRYVLESYKRHPYFFVSLTLIGISLFFQVAVGIGLIINSRYNVKDEREICKANKINNFTVAGIFLVTVVNVFISAFGVADPPPDMNA